MCWFWLTTCMWINVLLTIWCKVSKIFAHSLRMWVNILLTICIMWVNIFLTIWELWVKVLLKHIPACHQPRPLASRHACHTTAPAACHYLHSCRLPHQPPASTSRLPHQPPATTISLPPLLHVTVSLEPSPEQSRCTKASSWEVALVRTVNLVYCTGNNPNGSTAK